jgi:hypothetical protein
MICGNSFVFMDCLPAEPIWYGFSFQDAVAGDSITAVAYADDTVSEMYDHRSSSLQWLSAEY